MDHLALVMNQTCLKFESEFWKCKINICVSEYMLRVCVGSIVFAFIYYLAYSCMEQSIDSFLCRGCVLLLYNLNTRE